MGQMRKKKASNRDEIFRYSPQGPKPGKSPLSMWQSTKYKNTLRKSQQISSATTCSITRAPCLDDTYHRKWLHHTVSPKWITDTHCYFVLGLILCQQIQNLTTRLTRIYQLLICCWQKCLQRFISTTASGARCQRVNKDLLTWAVY